MQHMIEPQKWTFICLTHEYHFLGRSELKLYVDFKHKYDIPLVFPKITENLKSISIGMNGKVGASYPAGRSQPFFGQMSSFMMFNTALSQADVKLLYEIPPKHFANFQPRQGR